MYALFVDFADMFQRYHCITLEPFLKKNNPFNVTALFLNGHRSICVFRFQAGGHEKIISTQIVATIGEHAMICY